MDAYRKLPDIFNDLGRERMPRIRMLLSYWYFKDTNIKKLMEDYFEPPYPEIFADSGAFSAKTQGAEITHDEYIEWVYKWKDYFSVYASLDVIGNAEATWENQLILEQAGLNPLPIFHTLEDFYWLDQYIEKYNYIALGGMVGHREKPIPWLRHCFSRSLISDLPDRKFKSVFHGFGATSWKICRDFPWYSTDTSSWGQGFRFGSVPVFDTWRNEFIRLHLGDHRAIYKNANLLRYYGFEPNDLVDRSRYDRAKIAGLSALSYIRAEKYWTDFQGEIEIPNHAGKISPEMNDPGRKQFFVETTPTVANIVSANYEIKITLARSNGERVRRVRVPLNDKRRLCRPSYSAKLSTPSINDE